MMCPCNDNDNMHLIINFGDFNGHGDPHASLPLAGLSHQQPPGPGIRKTDPNN